MSKANVNLLPHGHLRAVEHKRISINVLNAIVNYEDAKFLLEKMFTTPFCRSGCSGLINAVLQCYKSGIY